MPTMKYEQTCKNCGSVIHPAKISIWSRDRFNPKPLSPCPNCDISLST